jgi:hypothetical protein
LFQSCKKRSDRTRISCSLQRKIRLAQYTVDEKS